MRFALIALLMMALMLGLAYPWVRDHGQKSVWQGPYLSGAANLMLGGDFLIDTTQIISFAAGDDPRREDAFRFRPSQATQLYQANDIGYCYWVRAATTLFPFLPDQAAARLLQALLHMALCLPVLADRRIVLWRRVGFLVLYALNPLVVRFVLFNHYYFYQCLPAFGLLYLLLYADWLRAATVRVWVACLVSGAVLGLCLLTRPSLIGLCSVAVGLALYRLPRLPVLAGLAVLAGVWLGLRPPAGTDKIFWHTAYIGAGAYTNLDGITLSDDAAYRFYTRQTGHAISASIGGNLYEPTTRTRYAQVLQTETRRLWAAHPGLYLRNASLNMVQALGLGYLGGSAWRIALACLFGLASAGALIYFSQYWLLAALVANAATVALFYPPIPAYIFGGYVLLAGGILIRDWGLRIKN